MSLFVRWCILPVYRLIVLCKLRFQRLAIPARSLTLFFVSSRYLFHIVLGAATIATIVVNLETRQASAQDIGQNSLLYVLTTNSEVEIVKEIASTNSTPASVSYLADKTMIAVPHVDFDYDTGSDQLVDESVPGAIRATPIAEQLPSTTHAPRTTVETYVVKDGDSIGSIADSFGINVGTLLWSNNLSKNQFIRPGDTLKVPPVSGILATVKKGDTLGDLATRYDGNEEEIRQFNNIVDDTTLLAGAEIMIPGGRPPQPAPTFVAIAPSRKQSPTPDTRRIIPTNPQQNNGREDSGDQEPTIPSAPAPATQKPADADTKAIPNTRLLWPTSGRVITQYYGWKHTGVDIDGDFTSPLYAAMDGEIITAGWNTGGYGLQIMIKHPNGMTTRYAHSSKLFVKVGDQVKKGQVIAMMGSTGHSTGSHLHFEVYVNGKRTNPLSYIR